MDLFKNVRQKDRYMTCADWLGNDEEVQLVAGDVRGQVQRCELHQRMVSQFWTPWGLNKGVSIKAIRCHYKTNVIAVMGSNNCVNIYSISNLKHTGEKKPYLVAKCEVKPQIGELEWFGNKLIFCTKTEVWEFNVDAADLLKREKQLHKSPINMEFNIIYRPEGIDEDHPLLSFTKFDEDTFLLRFKKCAKIEEHSLSGLKKKHTFRCKLLVEGQSFALHPSKRLIAIASGGGVILVDYKSGKLHQNLWKRSNPNVHNKALIFWSLGHPDTLLMFSGNRIIRYCVLGDRLNSSKPTPVIAYYSKEDGFPFMFRYDAMDNTNIDHNHRDNQTRFTGGGESNGKEFDVEETHLRKRNKVIDVDSDLVRSFSEQLDIEPTCPKRENSDDGMKDVKRPKLDEQVLEEGEAK